MQVFFGIFLVFVEKLIFIPEKKSGNYKELALVVATSFDADASLSPLSGDNDADWLAE